MHYSLTGNRLIAAPGFFDAPSLRGQGGDMPSPPKKPAAAGEGQPLTVRGDTYGMLIPRVVVVRYGESGYPQGSVVSVQRKHRFIGRILTCPACGSSTGSSCRASLGRHARGSIVVTTECH
jgi:hypothetical protein